MRQPKPTPGTPDP